MANWYNIQDLEFIYHNEWVDAEIYYNGFMINSTIIEDTMWERFIEDTGSENYDLFADYMFNNQDAVMELVEMCISEPDNRFIYPVEKYLFFGQPYYRKLEV